MVKLEYIVAGTGRCGTVAMAKLLSENGIMCGHESIFTPKGLSHALYLLEHQDQIVNSNCSGITRTDIVADSSFMAVPFLNHFQEAKIIHLVRHPLKVINSFIQVVSYFRELKAPPRCEYQKFLYYHYSLNDFSNSCDRAAAYYIRCNRMIEEACRGRDFLFHRIEDDEQQVLDFLKLGNATKNSPKNINHWKEYKNKCQLSDLSSNTKQELIEMSSRYNYHLTIGMI